MVYFRTAAGTVQVNLEHLDMPENKNVLEAMMGNVKTEFPLAKSEHLND